MLRLLAGALIALALSAPARADHHGHVVGGYEVLAGTDLGDLAPGEMMSLSLNEDFSYTRSIVQKCQDPPCALVDQAGQYKLTRGKKGDQRYIRFYDDAKVFRDRYEYVIEGSLLQLHEVDAEGDQIWFTLARAGSQPVPDAGKDDDGDQTATPGAPTPAPPAPDGAVKLGGFILWNFIVNADTVNNQDMVLWTNGDGPRTVTATARQTRLGLSVARPLGKGALTGEARVEADFFGGFPFGGQGETFPLPRMRIAAASMAGKRWKLTAGQDWVLLAPLVPETLSHQAVPAFAASGNLWARQPQLAATVTVPFGKARLDVSAAALAPVDADPDAAAFSFGNALGAGERDGKPAAEARFALSLPTGGARPTVLGVSAHFGEEKWLIQGAGDTYIALVWAASADLALRLKRVTILAEAYLGENLGAFMGGVAQGVRKVGGGMGALPMEIVPIASKGVWAQAIVALSGSTRFAVGAGLDDPDNDDLVMDNRAKNESLYATCFWTLAPVEVALEAEVFRTDFKGHGEPHQTLSVNLAAMWRF